MVKKPICVIDGDILAFKASAANEVRSIKALHKPSQRSKIFKHRTELKELIGDKFPFEDFEITDVQECEDVSHALHTVKQMIKNICEVCGTDKFEIYLSGKDNFRDELELPQKYKGNREGLMIPLQLKEVKRYLVDVQGALIVQGEADDKISMRQWEGLKAKQKVIGCSTDKDSMGTDGYIYNWDKMDKPTLVKGLGELYLDSKSKVRGHGSKWKYLQWLVGDQIDGLNPCYLAKIKFGEKSAYKILKDLETDRDCWQTVHDLYKSWYPKEVTYVDQCGREVTKDYLGLAQVYWDGIHMLRWEGDFVDIRGVMQKMGIV